MAQLTAFRTSAQRRATAMSSRHSSVRELTITPELMAQAGVPFELARWYHCVGTRLPRPNPYDEICVSQVEFHVACSVQ